MNRRPIVDLHHPNTQDFPVETLHILHTDPVRLTEGKLLIACCENNYLHTETLHFALNYGKQV